MDDRAAKRAVSGLNVQSFEIEVITEGGFLPSRSAQMYSRCIHIRSCRGVCSGAWISKWNASLFHGERPTFQMHATFFRRSRNRGFTLIEMLVVIGIIAVLLTMGAVGLRNMAEGKGTAAAVSSAEALFAEAKAGAMSRGGRARVLVDVNDINNRGNYLRRLVVAYEVIDGTTGKPVTPEAWEISNRGYVLPEGVFFSKIYSRSADGNDIPPLPQALDVVGTDYDGNYLYYEFNGEGISTSAGSGFVVGGGARPPGSEPRSTGTAKKDFAGFTVWRNGSTSTFRDVNQISNNFPTTPSPF